MPDNDPQYYRLRAERARQMADAAHDPAIKKIHERMAEDYESLAKSRIEILQRVTSVT